MVRSFPAARWTSIEWSASLVWPGQPRESQAQTESEESDSHLTSLLLADVKILSRHWINHEIRCHYSALQRSRHLPVYDANNTPSVVSGRRAQLWAATRCEVKEQDAAASERGSGPLTKPPRGAARAPRMYETQGGPRGVVSLRAPGRPCSPVCNASASYVGGGRPRPREVDCCSRGSTLRDALRFNYLRCGCQLQYAHYCLALGLRPQSSRR
eukprot:scaffold5310_cov378-Prasinococcus_capsulatus_cf.AAC.13